MYRKFDSRLKTLKTFGALHTDDNYIKNEPMFFNSSLDYAHNHGSNITRSFIFEFMSIADMLRQSIPLEYFKKSCVFDSRVHMLMPGYYPCIPGWHHDDIIRTKDGQPNYDNPEYHAQHVMGIVGNCSKTQFLTGAIELEDAPEGVNVYKHYDEQINQAIYKDQIGHDWNEKFTLSEAEPNKLIHFDCHTFHRGMPATKQGWRWFGRVSWNTHRIYHITNEIRRQTQVYIDPINLGW